MTLREHPALSGPIPYILTAIIASIISGFIMFSLGATIAIREQTAHDVIPLTPEREQLQQELAVLKEQREWLKEQREWLNEQLADLPGEPIALADELHSTMKQAGARPELAANPTEQEEPQVDAEQWPKDDSRHPQLVETPPTAIVPSTDGLNHRDLPTTEGTTAANNQNLAVQNSVELHSFESQESQPAGFQSPQENRPYPGVSAGSQINGSGGVIAQALQRGLEAYRAGNYDLAFKTWLPLAQQGSRRAQFYIGGLYLEGRGVESDKVQSHYWLTQSYDAGFAKAKDLLEIVEQQMAPEELAASIEFLRSDQ